MGNKDFGCGFWEIADGRSDMLKNSPTKIHTDRIEQVGFKHQSTLHKHICGWTKLLQQHTLKTSKMDVLNVMCFFVKPKNVKNVKTQCFLSIPLVFWFIFENPGYKMGFT